MLNAGSLLFAGIDDSDRSPTNAGLTLAIDVDSARQVPLHAQVPLTGTGISGLAFTSNGDLVGATSAGPGSTSNLVRIDTLTGVRISSVPITAGAGISIGDLAVSPDDDQIYGVRSAHDGGGGAGEIYRIDAGTGLATFVGRPNIGTAIDGGLAFGPDGTLYYTTANSLTGAPELQTLDPATAARLSSVLLTGSQGYNSGLAYRPEIDTLVGSGAANGEIVEIDPATGARSAVALEAPARGIIGDLAFQPDSPNVQHVHRASFETGREGYTADNTGRTIPGYWHYSLGRFRDDLLNHSLSHSWYYGAFETPTGGGNYSVTNDHKGVLISPEIEMPEAGASILSFSYLLDTRSGLTQDFVYVSIDDGTTIEKILMRESTLPQTGRDKWLTSTYDLSEFNGKTIRVRFTFDTGEAEPRDPEGWYVDDVQISNFQDDVLFGSLHGFKYNDVNGDGSFDDGEPTLPGVAFTLTERSDANDNGIIDVYQDTTGDDGRYEFTAVPPGDYTLAETVAPEAAVPGILFMLDVTIGEGEELVAVPGSVELGPGQFETPLPELAVPNTLYGSLHGFKFNDVNGDASFDENDTPRDLLVAGVTFTLTAILEDGSDGETFSAVTGADGGFTFLDVLPGRYRLDEAEPPEAAVEGTQFSLIVDIRSGEELVAGLETADLKPGQFETLLEDLAVANTLYGSVHGFKFFDDVEPNGEFDEGETLAEGIVLTLTEVGVSNGRMYTTMTGPDGTYAFVDVHPGMYTLEEVPPAAPALPLEITIRSGEELVVELGVVELRPGQFETLTPGLAIANPVFASISGLVWIDVNGNAVVDGDLFDGMGEAGIPNVRMSLFDSEMSLVTQTVTSSAVMDLDGDGADDPIGSYYFEVAAAGDYVVQVDETTLPEGYELTTGFDDPAEFDNLPVTVGVQEDVVDVDFGYQAVIQFGTALGFFRGGGQAAFGPFVRPADEPLFDLLIDPNRQVSDFLAFLQNGDTNPQSYQVFRIENTNQTADLRVADIDFLLATPGSPEFVTFYTLAQLQALSTFEASLSFPLTNDLEPEFRSRLAGITDPAVDIGDIAPGESVTLFAFYQPVLRNQSGNTVATQYPEWYNDPDTPANEALLEQGQAHTFERDDHVSFTTVWMVDGSQEGPGPIFQYQLAGGSTFDSDVFAYDGIVDFQDLAAIEAILREAWPTATGEPLWDPTTDINVRFPNGAEKELGLLWELATRKEDALGDFGVLNVEFNRARGPFLDLDPADNSARGVDFATTFNGTPVKIADAMARFANNELLTLANLRLSIDAGAGEQAIGQLSIPEEFLLLVDGRTVISFPANTIGNTVRLNTNIVVSPNFLSGEPWTSTLALTTDSSIGVADFPTGEDFSPGEILAYNEALRLIEYSNSGAATRRTFVVRVESTGGAEFSTPVDQTTGNVALARIHWVPSAASSGGAEAADAATAERSVGFAGQDGGLDNTDSDETAVETTLPVEPAPVPAAKASAETADQAMIDDQAAPSTAFSIVQTSAGASASDFFIEVVVASNAGVSIPPSTETSDARTVPLPAADTTAVAGLSSDDANAVVWATLGGDEADLAADSIVALTATPDEPAIRDTLELDADLFTSGELPSLTHREDNDVHLSQVDALFADIGSGDLLGDLDSGSR